MKTRLLRAFALLLMLLAASSGSQAACVIQSIAIGETKSGVIAADDCIDNNINGKIYYYDYYQFTATAGQKIAITNSSSTIDTDLLLIYPDGTTAYDDDSGGGTNARLPASGYITLAAAGKYSIVASTAIPQQTGAYTLTLLSGGGGTTTNPTVEYYNINLKHYFVTAHPDDITFLDAGNGGPGWVRTGHSFNVWLKQADAPADATPVCRFYGTPGIGPNSHFYSADRGECELVKQDRGWLYEGIAFYVQVPTNGACPANTVAVHRFFNNPQTAAQMNHRFTVTAQAFAKTLQQAVSFGPSRASRTGAGRRPVMRIDCSDYTGAWAKQRKPSAPGAAGSTSGCGARDFTRRGRSRRRPSPAARRT